MHRLLYITLLCMLAVSVHAQDNLYVADLDAASYPALRLSLRVVENGAPLLPVDPTRIVVREHGRLLAFSIDCPEPRPKSPSIALGFERSLDSNFPRAEAAAHAFLSRMGFTDDGAEASLWSFATTVDKDVDMTTDSARLARAVDDLSAAQWPFNGTALYETLHRAIEDVNAAGSGEAKAVVFFTDGYNNSTWYGRTLDDVRGRAAVDGIRVYVILIKNRDEGEVAMRGLCQSTGGFMVMHDAADAADQVYRDITRADSDGLWCRLETQSPYCANGTARILEIGYVRAPGDTLWSNVPYRAPRNDNALQPLHLWVSPAETFASDTAMTAVLGVEVRDGEQLQPLMLTMDLDPARLLSATALDWDTQWQDVGGVLLVRSTPPARGLHNGFYPLLRMQLRIDPSQPRDLKPRVLNQRQDCFRAVPVSYPGAADVALDTLLVDRGGDAVLHLAIPNSDLPEGLQRLDLSLSVDADHAAFQPPFTSQTLDLAPGWSILSADIQYPLGRERLRMRLSSDTGAAYLPLRIPLRTALEAPYEIPVRIDAAQTNTIQMHSAHGLVIVRDSCLNNVVVLTGLHVSQPWPQPARDHVQLRVLSTHDAALRVHIIDELGRAVQRTSQTIDRGVHILTLDLRMLNAGRYSLLFEDGKRRISRPLLLLP